MSGELGEQLPQIVNMTCFGTHGTDRNTQNRLVADSRVGHIGPTASLI